MTNISSEDIRNAISDILKNGDLNSLTARIVRKQLEEKFKEDLKERKKEIDNVLMELIDAAENSSDKKKNAKVNNSTDHKSEDDEAENSDAAKEDSIDDNEEIDDEALARKLQDEEKKTRSTRSSRKAPTAKKEKKESAPKKKRETAYSRKCLLSPELAAIVGSSEMARSEVVKKMWEVVRERNLFFPKNKQFALCDDQFLKVFGKKKIRIFGMMKHLKKHITDMNI